MKETSVKDLRTFLTLLEKNNMANGTWGFRGIPSEKYDLIPCVGRKDVRVDYDLNLERTIFARFRQMAIPFVRPLPTDDVAWLAVARHQGLPTRLLDWTLSPLVAAFFATEGTSATTLQMGGFSIYAYDSGYFDDKPQIHNIFEPKAAFVEVIADHYSERMAAQRSFFTLHKDPTQPFRHKTMIKFNFPDESAIQRLSSWIFME
jgi:hypothetical protein